MIMTGWNDALLKVQHLLNCLKVMLGVYLDVGNEVSLDEDGITSRSRYGQNLIMYNSIRPDGKYHFLNIHIMLYRHQCMCENLCPHKK